MRKLTILFAVLVFGFANCMQNYSNGERTGVVTKLSKKGFVFKSWEGEMLMSLPADSSGAINPEKFMFSVKENAVESVQDAMKSRKQVILIYRQWGIKPPTIDTEYVVTNVNQIIDYGNRATE